MKTWKQRLSFVFNYKSCGYKGFTLAEVLITIGIIGIIAEVTIPTLMSNIQNAHFKAAAKEAYSKSYQALNQMLQDNGNDLVQYFSTGAGPGFMTDFRAKFKIADDCYDSVAKNNRACTAYTTSSPVYKTLYQTGNPAQTYCFASQFVTTDGMFWGLLSNPPSYYFITVDVNGYGKGPNVFGRDTFLFQWSPSGALVPMGTPGTYYAIGGTNFCSPSVNAWGGGYAGYGCMYYVMQGTNY